MIEDKELKKQEIKNRIIDTSDLGEGPEEERIQIFLHRGGELSYSSLFW